MSKRRDTANSTSWRDRTGNIAAEVLILFIPIMLVYAAILVINEAISDTVSRVKTVLIDRPIEYIRSLFGTDDKED